MRPPKLMPFVLALLVISGVAGWALGEQWRQPSNAPVSDEERERTSPHRS